MLCAVALGDVGASPHHLSPAVLRSDGAAGEHIDGEGLAMGGCGMGAALSPLVTPVNSHPSPVSSVSRAPAATEPNAVATTTTVVDAGSSSSDPVSLSHGECLLFVLFLRSFPCAPFFCSLLPLPPALPLHPRFPSLPLPRTLCPSPLFPFRCIMSLLPLAFLLVPLRCCYW
jgi:hypothetical protein